MSCAYGIQIAGRTAGVVARDHSGQAYRFFASSQTFHALDGVLFDAPEQTERAARRLAKSRTKSRTPFRPEKVGDLKAFDGFARLAIP
jgi:hypothetical protein